MIPVNYEIIVFLILKIIIVLIGALCIYLGYKLFLKGIDVSSGDFEASNRLCKIKLLKAAPGTFLFLIGGLIICYTLFTAKLLSKREGEEIVKPLTLSDSTQAVKHGIYDSIAASMKMYKFSDSTAKMK